MTNNAGKVNEAAAAKAYRALERMVVTLELAPGMTTTEGALIERVGLGRTPVREALQRLSWEGLAEIRPRAGIAIAPLDPTDWLRVLEARRGIERVLARSAARFVSGETARLFHTSALAMRKSVTDADVLAFFEADKALDEAMAQAADNPFAARLVAPLQTHSRRFWFRYRRENGIAEAAERHVALGRAVLEHDETAAEAQSDRLMDLLTAHAKASVG